MRVLMREGAEGRWKPVSASGYQDEAALRDLVFDSPSVIPLEEVRPGVPPLVAAIREFGLPGSGSTDVLAFNAQGDIAVVECKLATNDEIKRKVIGQILEYGAYLWGMSYQTLDERVVRKHGVTLVDLVARGREKYLTSTTAAEEQPDWDEATFRQGVEGSLAGGKFILVIAVDTINDELARTIRFVNGCGNPAFSFAALEVPRFSSGAAEILVPHLYGPTSPTSTPSSSRSYQWTAERFFDVLSRDLPTETVKVFKDLYEWATGSAGARGAADAVDFGKGGETGSFTFKYVTPNGTKASVFSAYTYGTIQLDYGWLRAQVGEDAVRQFHQNLTANPAFRSIPADFSKWPKLPMEEMKAGSDAALGQFKAAVTEFGRLIRRASNA